MLRTFQFRLRPNAMQVTMLTRILADNCETYNAALQERRDAWRMQRKRISYRDQQNQLTELRKNKTFCEIATTIMRDPLRRLDLAFKAFFRRCRSGEKPGYPRFKAKTQYSSFKISGNRPVVRERSIRVPNVGDIRMRGGRPIQGIAKEATVKRIGNKWQVSICCDIGTAPEKVVVSSAVGIDVGLTSLITLTDGSRIANPRWTRKHEFRIAEASRRLARKQRRSKNRLRAKEVLRRAHQRAADARSNYLHHVSKQLVGTYDLIAHEDLKIKNMSRSASGTVETPGKNVKQKSGLNKSIMDAAWGQLLYQLAYKAESAGKHVIAVNPRGTSQRCSGCGETVKKELSQRTHDCPHCGLVLDRDHNAAKNILALGMSVVAAHAASEQIQGVCR